METRLKLQQLFPGILLVSTVSVLIAAPAVATIPQLSEVEQPLTTAEGLLVQQPAPTTPAPAQVTGVQLKPTDKGLEVILETASEFPEVLTSSVENSLVTDIPNAQLSLPSGGAFRQDNPTKDIASVEVTNLDAKTLRVTVTGLAGVPTAEVSQSPQALILSVVAPAAPAPQPTPAPIVPPVAPAPPAESQQPEAPEAPTPEPQAEEERLELTVTAEEEGGYNVPNATTATRTDTLLLDIPQSIQVIPRQVIEDQQAINLRDVLSNLSGVNPSGSFTNTVSNFTIRGFDDAPILRDGFRQNPLNRGIPPLFDLERVEVLRGPSSILYGEVQPGGVINLVSKQPLAEPFYDAELQFGNRALIRPQIDISGPLTPDDSLLYRLNLAYESSEPFQDFRQGFKQVLVSPVVTWKPSDRTDVTLRLRYYENEAPAVNGLVAIGDEVADVPFDTITTNPNDPGIQQNNFNFEYNLEHRFNDNWRVRNAFFFSDFSQELALTNVFFVNEETGILGRVPVRRETDTQNYNLQTNVIGEVTTGPIEHTLLFGIDLSRIEDAEQTGGGSFETPLPLDIFDPDYDTDPEIDFDELPFLPGFDFSTRVDRLGVYLQDQVGLLDNLILLAGFRYDTVQRTSIPFVDFGETGGPEITQNDDALTPRVGIVYKPVPAVSLYGSYSQSFTPSIESTAAGDPLEPERGAGFEVGVKTELLEGRLLTTLAYFDITKQNVAAPDPDPNNPFGVIAAGEQRSRGVELEAVGEILPGWNIIASYAYIDAEVTAEVAGAEDVIPVGNRLFNVPANSANLWTTYEIQQGNLQGLGFGLGFNFVGERQGDLENSFQVDSYFLTNAAVYYRRNNWQLALNVKNLFDINYIQATDNLRRGAIEPGDPFTVIGSVSVEF